MLSTTVVTSNQQLDNICPKAFATVRGKNQWQQTLLLQIKCNTSMTRFLYQPQPSGLHPCSRSMMIRSKYLNHACCERQTRVDQSHDVHNFQVSSWSFPEPGSMTDRLLT